MPEPRPSPAATAPAPESATEAAPKKPAEVRDTFREVVETVVFVVVLVVLLKTFVAEAFVIPTGSMAETLYGYQFVVNCPSCGYTFPVNGSGEVDPQSGRRPTPVTGCKCPNCDLRINWEARTDTEGRPVFTNRPSWGGGDRVLVAKFLFDDQNLFDPELHDVVVFKYPVDPIKSGVALNYIKRLEGLPGQTIAIFNGDLYASRKLTYDDPQKYPRLAYVRDPSSFAPNEFPGSMRVGDKQHGEAMRPARPEDLWQPPNMFPNAPEAVGLFRASLKRAAEGKPELGDFVPVRRSLAKIDSMKRIVFDNDFLAVDLAKEGVPHRWRPEGTAPWKPDDPALPRSFSLVSKAGEEFQSLRYHNLVTNRTWRAKDPDRAGDSWTRDEVEKRPVEDHIFNDMGYNSGEPHPHSPPEWVGDLLLDTTVELASTEADGELRLELVRGSDRFQARFKLADGSCSLWRVNAGGETELKSVDAASAPARVSKPGTYRLRFMNVDRRLAVTVNGTPLFGDGVEYAPASGENTPTDADKRPAAVAARGAALKVSGLKLWRDTHYTLSGTDRLLMDTSDSKVRTYYVQPGHFLCLGDNSAESSDSRFWGLVPARLMLGRAMTIYFPVQRLRVIK